jgi:hypothetical protein
MRSSTSSSQTSPGEEAERDRSRRAWLRRPWPFVLLPLVVIAIASTGGHLVWLALPLFFLFVVRPFVWRSSSRGRLCEVLGYLGPGG